MVVSLNLAFALQVASYNIRGRREIHEESATMSEQCEPSSNAVVVYWWHVLPEMNVLATILEVHAGRAYCGSINNVITNNHQKISTFNCPRFSTDTMEQVIDLEGLANYQP